MIDTINQINRIISQQLSLPEDVVKRVNAYYWRQGIKKNIASGLYTSVRIKNLGTFVISRNKLRKKILSLIREIRYLRADKPSKIPKEILLPKKQEELTLLLRRRNDIAQSYYTNQVRRNEKITKKHLGQQGKDSTGTSQQDTTS